MASQQQQISTSTVILATAGTLAAGALAYAAYFDYRRRSDPEFRKSLKKQHKKVQKAKEEEGKAAEQGQKEKIKRAVEEANEDGFPRDPEETEGYFMQEVAAGERMCQDGSDPVDAALCFYKALKVYPQPRELITIYDKTVPKVCYRILRILISPTNNFLLAHPRHPRRDDRCRPQHIRQQLDRRRRLHQRRVNSLVARFRPVIIILKERRPEGVWSSKEESCIYHEPESGQLLGRVTTHLTHVCCIQVYIYCFEEFRRRVDLGEERSSSEYNAEYPDVFGSHNTLCTGTNTQQLTISILAEK